MVVSMASVPHHPEPFLLHQEFVLGFKKPVKRLDVTIKFTSYKHVCIPPVRILFGLLIQLNGKINFYGEFQGGKGFRLLLFHKLVKYKFGPLNQLENFATSFLVDTFIITQYGHSNFKINRIHL